MDLQPILDFVAKIPGWLLGQSSLLVGALVGAIGSLLATWYYERATRPSLEIIEDDNPPAADHFKDRGWPPHKFLQLKVRQKRGRWLFRTRRPAWATRATMTVHKQDGTRAISEEIVARWSGAPEPLATASLGNQVIQVWDISKLPLGQRFDIHANAEQQLAVAVKFEGERECWIFSNESYPCKRWQKPEWRLDAGTYTVTLRVFYESGVAVRQFRLKNAGTSRNDFVLEWD